MVDFEQVYSPLQVMTGMSSEFYKIRNSVARIAEFSAGREIYFFSYKT